MENLRGAKICFVFNSLELGGAEKQGFLLARHLRDECGARTQIVGLLGKPGRLAELSEAAGLPWRGMMLERLRTRGDWLRALLRFALMMRLERPEVLVPYTKNPNVMCSITWRLSGARGCVWNQADEGFGMGREPISRLAVSLASRFVSNSTGGKRFLRETYRVPDERIAVVHNGIALLPAASGRRAWRERCGVREDAFVACMVANITQVKDHPTLLRAWKHVAVLAPMCPPPVLVLAGRFDGPERGLMQLAKDLGIDDRVVFLGGVDDVAGLLAAVDLFVYSSKSEGLPNAVVEAMAAGLPVVGTDIPGIQEAVGPTGEPFLSPPEDGEELARHIAHFIANPELCRRHGRDLRARAAAEFALPAMLERSVAEISRCVPA